jgi:hypothetical protein
VQQTLDALAASELITATYRRYLRSLLPIRDEHIAAALNEQITNSPMLTKGPLLEVTPPYAPGATLRELINEGVLSDAFAGLASPEQPLDRTLYKRSARPRSGATWWWPPAPAPGRPRASCSRS